jgi:hypothetical protein
VSSIASGSNSRRFDKTGLFSSWAGIGIDDRL